MPSVCHPTPAQGATEQLSCTALHRPEADSGPHTWTGRLLANSQMNKTVLLGPGGAGSLQTACVHPEKRGWSWSRHA